MLSFYRRIPRVARMARYSSSTTTTLHPSFRVVQESTAITDYSLDATLYEHVKSGAQVLSIKAQDDNKVFGISFRTPPEDSTGLPHILEHSRKYPVKEPFVHLLKGSLQTFLNAFTYPDRTCYPVASINTKDFYNLVDVYLDAVLHPRAIHDDKILQQEGWHYDITDPAQPLQYKGVVYNEMKGVYSSPDSLLYKHAQESLFPNTTYGVDSGGDPKSIPQLTFPQMQAFHRKYYHPGNARVFFYGDDDVTKRLELRNRAIQILDTYFSEYNRHSEDTVIKYQAPLTSQTMTINYPANEDSSPLHMISTTTVLNHAPMPLKDQFVMSILDHLLLGTPNAALKKALVESKLGESVFGGFDDTLLQYTFSVGMKGVATQDVHKVDELVQQVLRQTAQDGFDKDAIAASLNTIEFHLSEFNTGGYPKGLSIMIGVLKHWIYDGNPIHVLPFSPLLNEIKEDIKNGVPIFQNFLKQYVLDNNHRVTVEMKPDYTLEQRQLDEEAAKLQAIKDSLSPSTLQALIENTNQLQEAQAMEDTEEAKQTLPRLTLSDIDRTPKQIPIEVQRLSSGETILRHDLPSNNILYADVAFDFSGIEPEDLPLLRVFGRMLTSSGTSVMDETALERYIGINTGGIGASYHTDIKHIPGAVSYSDDAILYLVLRGKALSHQVDTLFNIMSELLRNANLNNQKRAIEMLKEAKAAREGSLVSSGHSYASTRIASKFSFVAFLAEHTGGITYARSIDALLDQAENDWPTMHMRLERLRKTILTKNKRTVVNLTAGNKILSSIDNPVNRFLDSLPSGALEDRCKLLDNWLASKGQTPLNEGIIIPSQVNYVARGGQLVLPGEPVTGAFGVISKYLTTGYLWNNVRVMGGAYGCSASFGGASGRVSFASYRDPQLVKTLETYSKIAEDLRQDISQEEITTSIIGSIGDMDSPTSIDSQGFRSFARYLNGDSFEEQCKWREELLSTKRSDFEAFADKLQALSDRTSTVVFGSKNALEEANAVLPEKEKLVLSPALLRK